jgi:hypothetical protein
MHIRYIQLATVAANPRDTADAFTGDAIHSRPIDISSITGKETLPIIATEQGPHIMNVDGAGVRDLGGRYFTPSLHVLQDLEFSLIPLYHRVIVPQSLDA